MCLKTRQWHAPYLPLFHVRPDMLPRIASNSEHFGVVAAGPLVGVPITGRLPEVAALCRQQ
jgi:glycerol kinase